MPSPGWKRKLCPKKWMDKFYIFVKFFLKILIWSPSLEKRSLLVSFYVENEKFFFSEKASGWGGSCRTESFIPYHSSSELAFGSLRVEGNIVFELFWSFPEKEGQNGTQFEKRVPKRTQGPIRGPYEQTCCGKYNSQDLLSSKPKEINISLNIK